jgi:hypothetical protein
MPSAAVYSFRCLLQQSVASDAFTRSFTDTETVFLSIKNGSEICICSNIYVSKLVILHEIFKSVATLNS